MKERPILFGGPMVRALLDGSKTQTRRVVKHQPHDDVGAITVAHYEPTVVNWRGEEEPGSVIFGAYSEDGSWGCKCPFGAPGDRLWVRETYLKLSDFPYLYRASPETYRPYKDADIRWRPSIHMPRAASRITLEVTGVRVERLQNISDADCIAEGIGLNQSAEDVLLTKPALETMPRAFYRGLWDSLAAPGADWDANPWVWVVEFKRVT